MNLFELYVYLAELLYSVFDIFMIAFYGNEIKSASDALSHRLYESVWIERGQAIRCNVLMFGEFLKKPIELVVLKLYPLTLETFMTVSFNSIDNRYSFCQQTYYACQQTNLIPFHFVSNFFFRFFSFFIISSANSFFFVCAQRRIQLNWHQSDKKNNFSN